MTWKTRDSKTTSPLDPTNDGIFSFATFFLPRRVKQHVAGFHVDLMTGRPYYIQGGPLPVSGRGPYSSTYGGEITPVSHFFLAICKGYLASFVADDGALIFWDTKTSTRIERPRLKDALQRINLT